MAISEEIVLDTVGLGIGQLFVPEPERRVYQTEYCTDNGKDGNVRSYRLCNGKYLEVKMGKRKSDREFAFHLGLLEARARRRLSGSQIFLGVAMACLLTAVMSYLMQAQWLITLLCALVTSLLFFLFFRSIRWQWVFYSRQARAAVIVIDSRGGDAKQCKNFIHTLSSRIADCPLPSRTNALAEETRLLRACQENGLITRIAYQNYRDYLLKQH